VSAVRASLLTLALAAALAARLYRRVRNGSWCEDAAADRARGNGLGVTSIGATSAAATKAITVALGKPTGHPNAGCAAAYAETG
jgi:hypothetical protein